MTIRHLPEQLRQVSQRRPTGHMPDMTAAASSQCFR